MFIISTVLIRGINTTDIIIIININMPTPLPAFTRKLDYQQLPKRA
jgi:hypothetical protein